MGGEKRVFLALSSSSILFIFLIFFLCMLKRKLQNENILKRSFEMHFALIFAYFLTFTSYRNKDKKGVKNSTSSSLPFFIIG